MFRQLAFYLIVGIGFVNNLSAQPSGIPLTPIMLQDMRAFKPAAANWRIVGGASAERKGAQTLQTQEGKGIIVNLPSDKNRDNLFTKWEHGDIELEMEFMMPKGSNSGVYLQGRYEIQLFDSWGVKNPKASDCGGIYERWDESKPSGQKGYEGHPPHLNVSRAPGLWQEYKIVFQAPRFDANGKKTANAKFLKVIHNGVLIHENVELSGPTRSAAFTDEKPLGPLMIQGDHGPVAVRNIRYKMYGPQKVTLKNIRYNYYEGQFTQVPDFTKLKPLSQGTMNELVKLESRSQDKFAYKLDGTVSIPVTGTYLFDLSLNWVVSDPHFKSRILGAGVLSIDGKPVITHKGGSRSEAGQVNLKAGEHPFTLTYFKNQGGQSTEILLAVEGSGVAKHILNAPSSIPEPDFADPIPVRLQQEPLVLRSFVDFNGNKRTQCALVAEPAGVHYAIDLDQGSLLQIWKGDFVDATDMWHNRGDAQVARPLGSVITLSGKPTFALLDKDTAAWPDSVATATNYQFKAYSLDPAGRPTFSYSLQGIGITDKILPEEEGHILTRELTVSNSQNLKNMYCRIAEASQITQMPDGSYAIDDMKYYVELKESSGIKPIIRQIGNSKELLIPVPDNKAQTQIRYSLIW